MPIDKKILKISDEEIVLQIAESNNSDLFEIIYDRYANLVYHKCLSFVKSKSEAQDLAHDIFVKLFVSLKTFNGNSKFSTWLYSITYNYCTNYVTRDKQSKNIQRDADFEMLVDTIDDDILDEDILSMNANKLNVALDKIDVKEKMILLMKYQDELSIKEIMKVLSLGESAVKMRIQRAKFSLIEAYRN